MSFQPLSLEKEHPVIVKVEGQIIFNLRQFLVLQSELMLRYDSAFFTKANPTAKDVHQFVDKYLFQIIEEIAEFAEEPIGSDTAKFELLDIMGYIGSLLGGLEKIVDEFIHPELPVELMGHVSSNKHLTQTTSDLLVLAVKARRLFPERKWHKDAPACSDEEIIERCKMTVDQLMQMLRVCLSYWNGVFGFGDNPNVPNETVVADGSIFDLAYDQKLEIIRNTFN